MRIAFRDGYVYFIDSDHGVKIGFSKKPFDRVRALGVFPFAVKVKVCLAVTDQEAAEQYYHNLHRARQIKGEWFRGPLHELLVTPDWESVGWRWDPSRLSFFDGELISNRPYGFSFEGIDYRELLDTRTNKALMRESEALDFALWRDDGGNKKPETADHLLYFHGTSKRRRPVGAIARVCINKEPRWAVILTAKKADASRVYRSLEEAEQALYSDIAYRQKFSRGGSIDCYWHSLASAKLIHLLRDGL